MPPHPKANKRNELQKVADLALMEKWHLDGMTQWQIKERLNKIRPYQISRQQVNQDMQKLQTRWLAAMVTDIGAARAKMVQSLDARRREIVKAWEKSKRDAQTVTVESYGGGEAQEPSPGQDPQEDDNGGKRKVTTEGQCGDPAFQRLLLDIDAQIAKLLGLNAPEKRELTGKDGSALTVFYLPKKDEDDAVVAPEVELPPKQPDDVEASE
jgi:hypothetical protein